MAGKSYRVRYPNGKEGTVSEAVAEVFEKREGHKVLYEVDRATGEKKARGSGGSAGSSSGGSSE